MSKRNAILSNYPATVSKEVLWHYQCSECKQWWTIGDPPGVMKKWISCPNPDCRTMLRVSESAPTVTVDGAGRRIEPELLETMASISTVDSPPEVAQVVDENFFDLIDKPNDDSTNQPPYQNNLRKYRERKMLSNYKLSKLAGCSPPTLKYIEAGVRQPQITTARKILEGLGVPFKDAKLVFPLLFEGER